MSSSIRKFAMTYVVGGWVGFLGGWVAQGVIVTLTFGGIFRQAFVLPLFLFLLLHFYFGTFYEINFVAQAIAFVG